MEDERGGDPQVPIVLYVKRVLKKMLPGRIRWVWEWAPGATGACVRLEWSVIDLNGLPSLVFRTDARVPADSGRRRPAG